MTNLSRLRVTRPFYCRHGTALRTRDLASMIAHTMTRYKNTSPPLYKSDCISRRSFVHNLGNCFDLAASFLFVHTLS